MIDLTAVPDEDLTREYMRRHNAKHGGHGRRPKELRPCKFCGLEFGGRDLRRHIPQCKRDIITHYTTQADQATRSKTHATKVQP